MSELETRSFEQLPAATAVSPTALTAVQEPGGPMQKLEIRQLLGRLISTEEATETEEDLQGLLDYDANSVGLVFADPDPALNGWYRKVGASGAGTWEQFEKLSADASAEVQALVDQAEDAADAAAASVAQAIAVTATSLGLSANATATIGRYEDTNLVITNGFYDPLTGAGNTVEGWRKWERATFAGERTRHGQLVTNAAMNLASYYDSDGDRIGDPIGVGTGVPIRYENYELVSPPGAVLMKGSGELFDTGDGPTFKSARIYVEAKPIAEDRADDVETILAGSQPFVEVDPEDELMEGYFNSASGAFVPSANYRSLIVPLNEGGWVQVDNAVKRNFPRTFVFAQESDGTNLSLVTGSADAGFDFGPFRAEIAPVQAPPRTRFVAVTTFLDETTAFERDIKVRVTQPKQTFAADTSRMLRALNRCHGISAFLIGTSIPAGGGVSGRHYDDVALNLQMKELVNEAIGGSAARSGVAARRTATDRNGWTGVYWGNLFVAMGKSLAQCADLIDNWGSKWRGLVKQIGGDAPPAPLSAEYQAQIIASSYETILGRHIGANRKQLIIDNHDYNDWGMAFGSDSAPGVQSLLQDMTYLSNQVAAYDPPSIAAGASVNTNVTYYGADVGQPVSATFSVGLPAGVTISAAVTAPDVVTVTFTNTTGGAVDLAAGNITCHLRFDRATFIGAKEFYLNYMWQDDPKCRWVSIGHFENFRTDNIAAGAMLFQQRNGTPLYKLWENLGWSQEKIVGGPADGLTPYEVWLPDGIHPFSDLTGRSRDLLAGLITTWLAANA
ncbi:MAG: hypothetical protein ACT6Q7_01770 [Blastomonas fulva]|uniref:hypothetical protein n=2 Tax=Blastomonas fulva TaxID=1550728 RepID=UPI00403428EA